MDQFLDSCVIYVSHESRRDRTLVLTVPVGAAVVVDGVDLDQWPGTTSSSDVGDDWQVVRVPVDIGAHALQGDAQFGVMVVAVDDWDSYCLYAGGMDQRLLVDEAPASGP